MGYRDGPDDRERAFAAELEVKRLQAELARQLQATRDVDDLRMDEIRGLNTRWTELRRQVQQARDDYYEQACDHGGMTGHGAQEERAFGRVEALDEVLGWLAEGEQ